MKKKQLAQDIITLMEYINHIKGTVNDLVWENYPNEEPTVTRETLVELMELIDPGVSPLLNSRPEWLEKAVTEGEV